MGSHIPPSGGLTECMQCFCVTSFTTNVNLEQTKQGHSHQEAADKLCDKSTPRVFLPATLHAWVQRDWQNHRLQNTASDQHPYRFLFAPRRRVFFIVILVHLKTTQTENVYTGNHSSTPSSYCIHMSDRRPSSPSSVTSHWALITFCTMWSIIKVFRFITDITSNPFQHKAVNHGCLLSHHKQITLCTMSSITSWLRWLETASFLSRAATMPKYSRDATRNDVSVDLLLNCCTCKMVSETLQSWDVPPEHRPPPTAPLSVDLLLNCCRLWVSETLQSGDVSPELKVLNRLY